MASYISGAVYLSQITSYQHCAAFYSIFLSYFPACPTQQSDFSAAKLAQDAFLYSQTRLGSLSSCSASSNAISASSTTSSELITTSTSRISPHSNIKVASNGVSAATGTASVDSGPSTSAKIGIDVGAGAGILAILALVGFFWLRQRHSSKQHTMLATSQ